MNKSKQNIRDFNRDDLFGYFELLGEKKFRVDQVWKWLWVKGIDSFDDMQNIPKSLIERLKDEFLIDKVRQIFQVSGKDKTTKFLFEAVDNSRFEGVLIPSKERVTACISTQMGCPLNCSFCATAKLGFSRNLTSGEIFDQVFLLNKSSIEIFNKNLSNIVIMGMGEPLLNYDNTMKTIDILCSEVGMGMSPQRITLSTAGIAPKIKKLADDNVKFNLSISLHSADNTKRSEIMPVNRKYDLGELREAIGYFYSKTRTRITYEYLMLNGVNDSIDDAKLLTEFTKVSPCKINIIEYNANDHDKYMSTDQNKLQDFVKFLESKNLVVTLRRSKGQDISAACGQLANKHNNFII